MARRTGLREFQLSVAERIRTADKRTAVSSKLGFQVGADNWFVALHQVNEVIPVPQLVPVPLTHSWFRGVANIVSDRLLGGAGLLVSRMLGLRNPDQFTPASRPADAPAWVGGVFNDAGGTRWLELDLPALVREQRFLEVGA
jgi:twitching motility protein PilI